MEIFRTQPTVPRPAVPSPQSYSLQSTVHHPSSSSVIYSSNLSTIHYPPRPCSLKPTVHGPFQSTAVYSPPPFTVRHPPSPRPSTVHHPPHPSHFNRIAALPNGRPTSESWRQPGCSPVMSNRSAPLVSGPPVPSVRKVFIMPSVRKVLPSVRKVFIMSNRSAPLVSGPPVGQSACITKKIPLKSLIGRSPDL